MYDYIYSFLIENICLNNVFAIEIRIHISYLYISCCICFEMNGVLDIKKCYIY